MANIETGPSMNTLPLSPDRWSTASQGKFVDTSGADLSALGEHLDSCQATHGHLFSLQCVAQSMHGFVSSRFVTTVVLVALLVGLYSLIF
jgi:hypothetical protein